MEMGAKRCSFLFLLEEPDSGSLQPAARVCRYLLLLNWLLVYNLLHTARMCIKASVIAVVGLNELSVPGRQRAARQRTPAPAHRCAPRLLWHQPLTFIDN